MKNKRYFFSIIFTVFLLLFILVTKSKAALNITSTQTDKNPATVNITSDKSIKKLYIYKKNSKNRFTLLLIQNGNNKTSLQTQISINQLSTTGNTEFKAIAIYPDTTETQLFSIRQR